jgi:hypothetical protein
LETILDGWILDEFGFSARVLLIQTYIITSVGNESLILVTHSESLVVGYK